MSEKEDLEVYREDSEVGPGSGLTNAALKWIKEPSDRHTNGNGQKWPEAFFIPSFDLAATRPRVVPGVKESYLLLPFRALQDDCLPPAIQQRWKVSVAASMSGTWRLWFQKLDRNQQKACVRNYALRTKDAFWTGLLLEYEQWSTPRSTRLIEAAARAAPIKEQEALRFRDEQRKKAEVIRKTLVAYGTAGLVKDPEELFKVARIILADRKTPGVSFSEMKPTELALELASVLERKGTGKYAALVRAALRPDESKPREEPTPPPYSPLLAPQDSNPQKPRGTPHSFCPSLVAAQIFRGKSFDEAMAEKRASLNSWTRESSIMRFDNAEDLYLVKGVLKRKKKRKDRKQESRPMTQSLETIPKSGEGGAIKVSGQYGIESESEEERAAVASSSLDAQLESEAERIGRLMRDVKEPEY